MNVPNDVKVIEHFLKIHGMALLQGPIFIQNIYQIKTIRITNYFDSRYFSYL